MELFNNDPEAPLPDLKKADIFSLGILAFELVERRRVLPNGPEWHALREGRFSFANPNSVSPEMQRLV
jgi:antitoxin component HigA of HigAB toxin-antitoxin module